MTDLLPIWVVTIAAMVGAISLARLVVRKPPAAPPLPDVTRGLWLVPLQPTGEVREQTANNRDALRFACELAPPEATLVLLLLIEVPRAEALEGQTLSDTDTAWLHEAEALVKAQGRLCTVEVHPCRNATEELLRTIAQHQAQRLLLTLHPHNAEELLTGLVSRAACEVLLYRP